MQIASRMQAKATVIEAQDDATPRSKKLKRWWLREMPREKQIFDESDRIRDELAKMGVVLKDSKDGTTWEIAR